MMEAPRVEAALDRLVRGGLVEEVQGELRTTRRWSALLLAAAEKLNQVAQRTGAPPEGNPLVLAVSQALASENLAEDEILFQEAVEVLVILELSRMKPSKRAQAGFPDARFPGDPEDDKGGSGVDFHPQPP